MQKVRGLGVGELGMSPCGWVRADGSGHCVVFVVMRQEPEVFSVSVVNPCGEGSEYHAQEADPARGKVRYPSILPSYVPLPYFPRWYLVLPARVCCVLRAAGGDCVCPLPFCSIGVSIGVCLVKSDSRQ